MAHLKKTLIAAACLIACGAAIADPVSLISLAAAGAGAAGLISATTAFLISAGAGLLGAAQARRQQRAAQAAAQAQYNASLQDRNVTTLNNEDPWQIIYGNPAPVGGALVAMHTSGNKDQYKHLVIVWASHECQAIDEIYIEGVPVGALDGQGWATVAPFNETATDATTTEQLVFNSSGVATTTKVIGSLISISASPGFFGNGDVTYTDGKVTGALQITAPSAANLTLYVTYTSSTISSRVNIQHHLSPDGSDTADAFLISQIPSKWTTAHRLSGYTYSVITLDLNYGRFQGGPPNITAKIRGKKVYDWRTGLTAYSNNPALCAADFIMAPFGMGQSTAQIDSTAAITAANACDTQGFTCDGAISTGNARDANLNLLEDCMVGQTHFSGGVWRIIAGAYASPVMPLTDSTTLADSIQVVQASNGREARYTGVRGQYVPANGLGVAADFTPYSVGGYVSTDGSAQYLDLNLPFTGTNAVCQKIAAIKVEQSRLGLTINYPAHLSAWKLQPGDRVTVTNAELGFAAKVFRVQDWTFMPNAPVGLVLTEDNASVWTGTFTTADPTLATSNLVDPWAKPAAPDSLIANSGNSVLLRASDGTIITRVLVTWTASSVRSVLQGGYTQLQWRSANVTDNKWTSFDLPADASSYYLTGPVDGSAIIIRVRFMSGLLVQGTWATIAHTVLGKTAPPTAPSYVSANAKAVYWGAVTDLDLAGYRIRAYPGSSGAVWSQATPLHNDLLTTGPWAYTTTLWGTQTIMVASEDTSGNVSTPVTAVVDFSQPDASNTVAAYDFGANAYPGTITNGTVVSTTLTANVDVGNDLYAVADLYAQGDVYASTYKQLQWVSTAFVPPYGGGTITLAQSITGSAAIEYMIDGSTTNDLYSAADNYASSDLYALGTTWTSWPGGLPAARMQGVLFRVTVAGGSTQGVINSFAPALVMPDVRQTFASQSILASGQRLSPSSGVPARKWISIKTAQVTPIVDGTTAIAGRVLDFSPSLGPNIQLIDYTGTSVAGTATVDLGGLADV